MNNLLLTTGLLGAAMLLPLAAEDFHEDFSSFPPGEEPGLFILDGTFTIAREAGGNQVLELLPEPLTEGIVQLGPSLRGGGIVEARIQADAKRRLKPRFGLALHGSSGFKVRVVPASGVLELVRNEETLETVPFDWTPSTWYRLRLEVAKTLDPEFPWRVAATIWEDATPEPAGPLLVFLAPEARFQGKASVVGTPYAGLPIRFDDIAITPLPDP